MYGVYSLDRQICLVSPWMQGGDLTEYLKGHPEAHRLPLVSQFSGAESLTDELLKVNDVAQGLLYLHENNVIHGDLKGVSERHFIFITSLTGILIAEHSYHQ